MFHRKCLSQWLDIRKKCGTLRHSMKEMGTPAMVSWLYSGANCMRPPVLLASPGTPSFDRALELSKTGCTTDLIIGDGNCKLLKRFHKFSKNLTDF